MHKKRKKETLLKQAEKQEQFNYISTYLLMAEVQIS